MPGQIDSAPKKRGAGLQKSGWGARAWVEIALMTLGLALLAAFCGAQIDSYLSSRAALKTFSRQRLSAVLDVAKGPAQRLGSTFPEENQPAGAEPLEHRLESRRAQPAALAVLRIPKINLEVPVLNGTDARTLNRGAGWIEGTAKPGDRGNVGIAGHRDSFFRGLKDLKMNDTISLQTSDGTASYVVEQIRIVKPEDVSVLDPTPEPMLTLVTCYPFRFIGSAPKRYVVTARLVKGNPDRAASASLSDSSLAAHLSQFQ